MHPDPQTLSSVAADIWAKKYRLTAPDGTPIDATLADTWRRVAQAAAAAEKGGKQARQRWADRFEAAMSDLGMLPAGRIIAGAGSGRDVTLFNCFVMGRIEDDLGGIFSELREAALTLQQGGGIGHDFSTLRPKGALVRSIGAEASGPVSFMEVWDAMCRTIMSAGARRGAMMATLRCDHPDIETFIAAKSERGRLTNFNLSVLVTDELMQAVAADGELPLRFAGRVHRRIGARELWDRIMRATYEQAEPGVIFIDRINAMNNLGYCETIHATNPCGEQPLPPHGACLLGSINLARLVIDPFEAGARLDVDRLSDRVALLVRLLDNVIDVSGYPLPTQRREAFAKRRIGIGVTGLADALIMLGLRYGSAAAVAEVGGWMAAIERTAYLASSELAAERGSFPLFDATALLARPNIERLDPDVRAAIERQGLRNGCLTSIAPTGTISLLAGNVSNGIEPVFDFAYRRRILDSDGTAREQSVEDYAYALYRRRFGPEAPLTPAFVTAQTLSPADHLAMQAAVQRHVDSSISKTINCPPNLAFDAFRDIYAEAYRLGLKGCTTFRPNAITGSVLTAAPPSRDSAPVPEMERPGSGAASSGAAMPARVEPASGPVVYLSKPLEREPVLGGFTYKIRWPGSEHALYVTINDIERDGRRRPFEIFVNTKNLEHYAWTVALTRMISAVFRRGGDVRFVVEELKAVFDPAGGRWVEGRYQPSLIAAIGETIETHMRRIGFLRSEDEPPETLPVASSARAGRALQDESRDEAPTDGRAWSAVAPAVPRSCPRCGAAAFQLVEGCWVCQSCGFSRCG